MEIIFIQVMVQCGTEFGTMAIRIIKKKKDIEGLLVIQTYVLIS